MSRTNLCDQATGPGRCTAPKTRDTSTNWRSARPLMKNQESTERHGTDAGSVLRAKPRGFGDVHDARATRLQFVGEGDGQRLIAAGSDPDRDAVDVGPRTRGEAVSRPHPPPRYCPPGGMAEGFALSRSKKTAGSSSTIPLA